LDFAEPVHRLRSVEVNGQRARPALIHDHIVLEAADLTAGENVAVMAFEAGAEAVHWRDGWCFTLFVPARAHTLFPCLDQPDLKARLSLALDLPAGAMAVANAPEAAREMHDGTVRWRFRQTPPLSTYLMAFAAGRLATTGARSGAHCVRLVHEPEAAGRVARHAQALADAHAQALDWLRDYTGLACPFEKTDLLLVPAFQFGGMEHPGAIAYQQDTLLPDEPVSHAADAARRHLIAHEVSHLWFGDLVTMPWFDDVWLKEVFANLMAGKIQASAGEATSMLRFYLDHYPVAYDVDRTAGATPIRQPLGNLARASELYGPIAYQKSPIAFAALEARVGPETFQSAVRAYLADGRWATAAWPDLLARVEHASGEALADWSAQWITAAGRRALRPAGTTWPPLDYAHVRLSVQAVEALLGGGFAEDAVQRAAQWVALFEAVHDGALEPPRYAEALMTAVAAEPAAELRTYLRGALARVWWRWLAPGQREALRARLEAACAVLLADPAAGVEVVDGCAGLLARTPEDVEALVRRQASRVPGPRQDARLRFLAPALSGTFDERDALARALGRGGWGVPERWVLEALALLHHPLRQTDAVAWVADHLACLPAVQHAGDIFLPRRWAHAVMGGHQSAEAAARVMAFTSGRPADDYLRRIVLEAADDLLRVNRR
ncbi:MAG: M1 family aminopeptidase, partial [Vicinamibacterales bacterium]